MFINYLINLNILRFPSKKFVIAILISFSSVFYLLDSKSKNVSQINNSSFNLSENKIKYKNNSDEIFVANTKIKAEIKEIEKEITKLGKSLLKKRGNLSRREEKRELWENFKPKDREEAYKKRKKLSKLNKNIKRNINNIQNLNKKIADMMRKREQLIRILKRG